MRAFAALCLSASILGAQTPKSYSYDFTLDPGGKKSNEIIHGTVRVSGSRARVDTDEKKSDKEKSYFLLSDGGRTVYVVHPERQEYEVHDADEFARVVGMAMKAAGPVLKLTVKDAKLDTARLGDGGSVAGRSTQRVQLRQKWKTSMRVLGFVKEDMMGSAVAEYWTDPTMPLMRNPLFDIVSTSLLALAASDEDFLNAADGARAKLYRGAPLKADVRMVIGANDGDDMTRLRYEVTKITPGAVNDADLALPKGYKKNSEHTFSM